MQCPEVWSILADELWHLPTPLSNAFWFALVEACWSRPVALRQALSLPGHMRLDLEHLIRQTLTAAAVIAVLEDLVKERQLRRSQATHIEEAVLRAIDRYGCYPGEHRKADAWCTTHAPDIMTLAESGRR